MIAKSKLSCAIYTRKSTDDGLEQDFNSLDAQREACGAFVKSQASLGWKLISKHYDDGGISGAHMERPALLALLEEIQTGGIDVVVVYKIDRLTRSLTDFARIVEVFDTNNVSFVSVTQQFNTTTSMGRLTLNVLLSFAQYEREVTAERIRDKIAASRKKGMWMGGLPPLGYDVEDKKLVVNETEASTVQTLFTLYLELRSVRRLKAEADRLGLKTKHRLMRGIETGSKPFTRGHLYQLLANPLYVGEVAHKGKTYPGQHQAIIDREPWNAVQQLLANNAVRRNCSANAKDTSLLTGLLFDETGDRLSPTHATKGGRRYRYYISHRLMQARRHDGDGWRIPAWNIEKLVIDRMIQLVSNDIQVIDLIPQPEVSVDTTNTALGISRELACTLASENLPATKDFLRATIQGIEVAPGQLTITIDRGQLSSLITRQSAAAPSEQITLTVPFQMRRRGVETKLIVENTDEASGGKDHVLIETIARGHAWFDEIVTGQAATIRDIASRESIDEGDVSRNLCFAFLAPDIIKAIVDGRQPLEFTAEKLKRSGTLPLDWQDQRRQLGFAA